MERNAKRKLGIGKMVQVGRDLGLGEEIRNRNTWEGSTMDEAGGVCVAQVEAYLGQSKDYE